MAHQFESGFFVGEPAWHQLGRVLEKPPSAEEAIKEAGLDWDVDLVPIVVNGVENDSFKAVTRRTDNSVYGVVKSGYVPLQNKNAFGFFNPFVENGFADFHTAGSLRGGETVWILAKINSNPIEVVKGDFVEKFLVLSHQHTGKGGIDCFFSPIRVVCANNLQAAQLTKAQADNNKKRRIVHSSKAAFRMEEIQ